MTVSTATRRTSRATSPGAAKEAVARPEEKENSAAVNEGPIDSQAKELKKTINAKPLKEETAVASKSGSALRQRLGSRRAILMLVLVIAMVALGCYHFCVGLPNGAQLRAAVQPAAYIAKRFVAKVRGWEPSPRTIFGMVGCAVLTLTLGMALCARRMLKAKTTKAAKAA